MEETWKDIKGYNGYQVSNLGRVRTHNKVTYTKKHGERHWEDRILKPRISKKDRCSRVELWKDGKHKTFLVHRLVADAFLERMIGTNFTVNHKDGNRLNNNVNNLEWVSRADNIRHAFNNGLIPCKKIKLINKRNNYDKTFRSMTEASKEMGRNHGYISTKIKAGIFENDVFEWKVI